MPFNTELGIPAPEAQAVWIRYSQYPHQQTFDPSSWSKLALTKKNDGWWVLDFPNSGLADGVYEYEFLVSFLPASRRNPLQQDPLVVPDPYAEELEKFAGYRGILYIKGGLRIRPSFSWSNELPANVTLPQNNQLVIYELPMRWIDAPDDAMIRQVDLGTFDKAIFERLNYMQDLGCNAIELLPIQDSPDTLNWGYGTRFFYAPDYDMGTPFDLKFFIKSCHQRGIRVILDIVMNHARNCPLRDLAYDWYFGDEAGRNAWGGDLFKYRNELQPGYFPSRSWQYDMASFWINEYRIDGFRIDEFNGIQNWDFIRNFRNNAWAVQQTAFPGRPFIVIAEDSARRPEVAQDIASGGKVADSIWDFDFRDEIRQLCSNIIITDLGKPSRSERVKGIITGDGLINGDDWRTMWNSITGQNEKAKFTDLSQRIAYITSHDIESDDEQRLYPYFLKKFEDKWGVDWSPLAIADSHPLVIEQFFSAFAIMLTTPGIPMFLAGEEFADLHDLPHNDWRQKMSDPINWNRLNIASHQQILNRIKPLIKLRSTEPCLQRNEVIFFGLNNGFHPTFDNNDGERVFAYCRSGGKSLGQSDQVAVFVNAGPSNYPQFLFTWPWTSTNIQEIGGVQQKPFQILGNQVDIELKPFQTRVFTIH
jgi:1,4-alpha-glucan branching enzyme